jgi:hypothetical protein
MRASLMMQCDLERNCQVMCRKAIVTCACSHIRCPGWVGHHQTVPKLPVNLSLLLQCKYWDKVAPIYNCMTVHIAVAQGAIRDISDRLQNPSHKLLG